MKTITTKLTVGGLGMLFFLVAANVLGQTNQPNPLANALPDSPNIIYGMLGQVLNNPSSLLVIGFLCIIAWLADDLPWIPSQYVKHLSVIAGMSIFWLFTSEATVPKSFPHPMAVFMVNGAICGFVAFIAHKQIVLRLIAILQPKGAADQGEIPIETKLANAAAALDKPPKAP